MKVKLEQLCIEYNLGCLEKEPELVTGGLMHKMYRVSTTQGEYAIKQLNPHIMKRPTALRNMINSEIAAGELKDIIPLIAAKNFEGKNVIESNGSYYMIFDWFDGRSVFVPDISAYHCEQIGRILGKIHAADVSVVGMEKNEDGRDLFDWKLLLETAKQQNEECHTMLVENLSDIEKWDNGVVNGWKEIAENQVISHRDLDPKNIMWKDDLPYIIDWESAGFVNSYQELIEVLNYWITDETGKYNKEKFDALMQAYTESVDICGVNWEVVLSCSFDGMLGWLEYSVKRALGLEGTGEKERQEGMRQTKGTIRELRKYEEQMVMLKDWIDEYVKTISNMKHNKVIRDMQESDWDSMARIYKQSLERGTATFVSECPTYEQWDAAHTKECRFVCEVDGQVVGYATIAPTSARPHYRGVVEVSVYVDINHLHKGIGTALLTHLCVETEKFGYWTLYSSIFSENVASIELHKKCGFRTIGYRERIAKDIFGKWQSTTIMERRNGIS